MEFDSYDNYGVQLATELVNSAHGDGPDELADVAGLLAFLARHDFTLSVESPDAEITARDLAAVRRLRKRLRTVFDQPDADEAAAALNGLLVEAGTLPQLTRHDGSWHFHYTAAGAPLAARLLAEAAIGLAGALRADGYDRMRTCAADDCADVFIDASRNSSRRFCKPSTCGNRATTAAYRARQRAAATPVAR